MKILDKETVNNEIFAESNSQCDIRKDIMPAESVQPELRKGRAF